MNAPKCSRSLFPPEFQTHLIKKKGKKQPMGVKREDPLRTQTETMTTVQHPVNINY